MPGDRTDISIVIPTYREAANVAVVVPRIASALEPSGRSFEILIVDDDSRDGVERVVADLAEGCRAELIVRTERRDLSLAVVEGLQRARGRVLVVMDADASHPPEKIPELLAALERAPTDLVLGSRFTAGGRTAHWGGSRRLNSWVATLLCRPLTGGVADPMAGFFALHRVTFDRADGLNPIGYKIGLELICRCPCRHVVEVPITFQNRARGESKLDLEQQARYLIHLDRLYRDFRRGWSVLLRPVIWVMLLGVRVLACGTKVGR